MTERNRERNKKRKRRYIEWGKIWREIKRVRNKEINKNRERSKKK